jgi:FlaA1/EpsC-like NDP-sugar epimerase
MTIPEACQLVLEAGSMGNGGEIFVFDMGQPVAIADLAKKMIRLYGMIPNIDINITYSGLRPGEKLHEEMISEDDSRRTIVLQDRYVVMPVISEWGYKPPKGIKMLEGKAYRSDTNDLWMSELEIRNFIERL